MTNNPTPTPRTDAALQVSGYGDYTEVVALARTLERELAEAHENIKTSGALLQSFERRLTLVEQDRDAWRECAEELARCVEQRVIPTGPCMFRYSQEHQQALATFNKLLQQRKESK